MLPAAPPLPDSTLPDSDPVVHRPPSPPDPPPAEPPDDDDADDGAGDEDGAEVAAEGDEPPADAVTVSVAVGAGSVPPDEQPVSARASTAPVLARTMGVRVLRCMPRRNTRPTLGTR